MSRLSNRTTRWLIRYRAALLTVAVVAAACAYFPASRLTLDRSIDTMFADDDPLLPPYHKLKRTFGGNDVVLCVYDDPDLLRADRSGMERMAKIGNRLREVPGVGGILSLDLPLGPRIVDPDNLVSLAMRDLFEGYTHGNDGRTASIACMLVPEAETRFSREETVQRLREEMQRLPDGLADGLVTGEPVMLVDAFEFVEQDGRRLVTTTTLLLGLVILVCFRSLRWVIIPILVVQLAVLYTNGLLALSGLRLTMVSSMLTAVVTVVGVATVVHVIVRFREGRESGLTPVAALTRTGRLLCGPIFWACTTDAVGFAALMAADVAPIRDFGMMMALGAVMVLVSAALIVPGLVMVGRRDNRPHRIWGESLIENQLRRLVTAAQDHPFYVGGGLLLVTALALSGIPRLEIDTDFTRNFRSNTAIVRSYQLVEANLGGAGVCDVILPAPSPLNWKYLQNVLRLEDQLRQKVPGLTKVLSLADAVVGASPVDLKSTPRFRRKIMLRAELAMMHSRIPEFYDALYGEDPEQPGHYFLRIMLRAKERQPAAHKLAIIRQIEEVCEASLPTDPPPVTGYFVLLTHLVQGVLQNQWRTFGVALVAIGLMMIVALRSAKLAAIALVPNVVPILLVNGLMGWLGWPINMGSAMIAAVSVGLSIDSSIHYLSAYRRARRRGLPVRESLDEVQQSVGTALVFATLALIVGFSVLAISQFVPTVYFGVLVSLSMLGGLIGNLLWLPMLIRLTESDDVTMRRRPAAAEPAAAE